MKDFLTTPVPNDEAADFIKSKPAVSRAVFNKLLPELKARAFAVTGLESATAVQNVRDAIAELPRGGDWDTIKKQIADQMSPYFIDDEADAETQAGQKMGADRRADLLLRLHGFQAYSAAAHQALVEDMDIFPYWQYKSMGDGKVRATHAALHNIILPAGDPFWRDHTGPWEYGCRCQKVGLMEIDVDEIRAADQDKPLEERRIIEGEAYRQLTEHGRLVKGPNMIFDVRSPVARGQKNAFSWNPDDLRLPLDVLKSRYDAPVWDAFQQWASATEIPGQGRSVWDWLSAGRTFSQPLLDNPDGGTTDVPEDFLARVQARLVGGATGYGPGTPLEKCSHSRRREIAEIERTLIGRQPEAGELYEADGSFLWSGTGTTTTGGRESIAPRGPLAGSIFTHDHPADIPHSKRDVRRFFEHGMAEIRVVTAQGTYSITPGARLNDSATLADLRLWVKSQEPLIRASVATLVRTNNLSDAEAWRLHWHSLWEEAARAGYLTFTFTPHQP